MARASFAWAVVAVIAAVVAVTSAQAVVDDITPSFAEVYPSASVAANGANLETVVYVRVAERIAIVTDVDTTNGLYVEFVPPPCYPTEGCETGQPVDVELFDINNDPVATLVGGFTYQASECEAVTGCATSGEFLTEIPGALGGIGANGFIVNSDDIGSAGFEFEVYETIEITHFGAYDLTSNGFDGDYVSIKLWKDSDQSLIHQETLFGDSPVNNNDLKPTTQKDDWQYIELTNPITLTAGIYIITGFGYFEANPFTPPHHAGIGATNGYRLFTVNRGLGGLRHGAARQSGSGAGDVFPATVAGFAGQIQVATATFKYRSLPATDAAVCMGSAPSCDACVQTTCNAGCDSSSNLDPATDCTSCRYGWGATWPQCDDEGTITNPVNPATGVATGGTEVTIIGTALSETDGDVTEVNFDGRPATIKAQTTTEIVVWTPECPAGESCVGSAVDVEVVSSSNLGSATAVAAYTYSDRSVVTDISPTIGPYTGGTQVTLLGNNLGGGTASLWVDGVEAVVGTRNGNTLVATTGDCGAASDACTAAAGDIVLVHSFRGTYSYPDAFEYRAPGTVTSVTPDNGRYYGGNTVIIEGTFADDDVTSIFVGLVPASFTSLGGGAYAVSPGYCGGGCSASWGTPLDITITSTSVGVTTATAAYTYNPAADITGVVPKVGPLVGGNKVTITDGGLGSGSDITDVDFVVEATSASIAATIHSQTASSVVVLVPACADNDGACAVTTDLVASSYASIEVTSTSVGVTTETEAYVWLSPPAPITVNAAFGSVDGGTTVEIIGEDLGLYGDVTSVSIAGVEAASFVVNSATKVTAVTGACSGGGCTADTRGPVVVTSVSRGTSSTTLFEPELPTCCEVHGGAGCDDLTCAGTVCGMDSSCCDDAWTDACVTLANLECTIGLCVPALDSCCDTHGGTSCSESTCADLVCANYDSTCCSVAWTADCATAATAMCNGLCGVQTAFEYKAKVINSVSPAEGPFNGGTSVTITGENLLLHSTASPSGDVIVMIGSVPATLVEAHPGWITVTTGDCEADPGCTPDDATSLDVDVIDPVFGWSAAAGAFTYNSEKTVTAITPNQGPWHTGLDVVIDGDFETGIETVRIGSLTSTDLTELGPGSVSAALTGTCTPGTYVVEVWSPTHGWAASSAPLFTCNPASMGIQISPSISASTGPGSVTFLGTNLGSGSDVESLVVAGVTASITSQTPTSVVANLGGCVADLACDTTGDVVSFSPSNGFTTLTNGYTYRGVPVIDSTVPPSGGQTFYGGHQVTIVGDYLADTDTADVTSVVLAGVPVTAVVASDPTGIIVEVGPCGDLCDVGTPGDIEVSSSAYGNSVLSGGYTYQEEACYQYDHTAACTTSIWEARDTLDDGVPGFLGTIIQEFEVTTTGVYALRLGLYDDDGLGVKGRVEVTLRSGDGATTIETTFAAVIGTPPYMVDGDGTTAFRTFELVGAPVHLAPGTWFLEADYVEAGERPVIGTDLGLNAVGGPWLDLVSTTVITDGGATTNVYSPSDVKALTLVVFADASNRAVCYGADFDCKACDVTHPCTSCDDTHGMYDVTTRCTTCLPGWGPAFPDCSDEGTITRVVPTHGPDYGGDTMTIYGTALVMGPGDAISVRFNSVEVPALDSGIDESGREYVVVETPPIPAGATLDTDDVSIQVVASSSYLASVASDSLFTYRSKPTIDTQDVNEGPHTGGTTVTFTGSNWLFGTSGVSVSVGGIAANVVSRTGTVLVITTNGNCETNPGCVTGTASTMVFTAPGIGTRTYGSIFTYNPPMVITDVQPTCGPAYGGIDLSIYGTNFGVDAADGVVSVGTGNDYSGGDIVTATPTMVVISSLAACGSFEICATDVDVTMVSTTHAATTAVDAFSYRATTVFDSVTPSTGPYHGGNRVTITGSALGDGQDIFRVTLTPADSAARTAASIEDQGMNFVVVTVPNGDLLCATATTSGCLAEIEVESVCSGVTTATGGYRFNPNPLTPDVVLPISALPLVPTEAGVNTVRTYFHFSGVLYHNKDIFAVSLVDGSGLDGAAVIDWATDEAGQSITITYGPCTAPVDTMLDLEIASLSFGNYTLEGVAECDELTISAPTPTIRPWFGADPLSIVTAKSRSSSLGVVDTVSAVYFGAVKNPASTNTFDGEGFGTLTVTSVPPCSAAGGCDGSPIDVTIAYEGAGSDTTTFSYYRQPMITMVEPTCGYRFGGRTVTVWGHDFGDVASVDFGGVAASVTASSSTAVVVVTGDCVGDVGCDPGDVVDVHVVSAVRGDATSAAGYEYLLATTIDAVTGEVTARAGGDRVTISGSNLQFGEDVTTVTLSGVAAASVVWQDEDMVVVDTAPCWDCRGCPGDVVVDSAKVGETTLIEAFEYLHAGAVTGVSPDWAYHYGTRVTVTGRQLGVEDDIYKVTVDGLKAGIVTQTTTSVVVDVPGCESSSRDCEVPVSSLPAGDVVVFSAHRGVSTATGAFRFRPKPTIGSILPTRGPYTGWSATIFGARMTTTDEVESVTVSLQDATVTSPIGADATSLPLTTPIYREADQKFTSIDDPFVSFPRAGGVGADLIMEFEVDCAAKGLGTNIRSIRFGLSYWARDGTVGAATTEVRYIASATQLFAPFDTSTWTAADDFVIDDVFFTATYSGEDVTILQNYGDPTTPCQPYYYVALENADTTDDNFFVSGCNPSDGVADDPDAPWHNSATVSDKAPFPPNLSFDEGGSLAIQSCSQMWYARKSANSLVGGFASETLGPVGLGSGGESDTTAFVFYPFDDTTLDNLIDAVVDEGLPVSEAHIDLAIGSGSATNVPPLTISGLLFDDDLNTLFESDYAAHITADVEYYHSGDYGAFPNGDDEYGPADAAHPIFDVVANLMSPNSFVQRATTSASVVWTLETSLTAATPASHTRSNPPGGTTDIYTFEIYAEDEIWVTALDPFRGFAASLAANVEVHYTAESGAPDPAWTLIGFSEVEASILFDEPIRIPSGESYAFRVEAVCGSFTTGPACDPADAGVLEEFNGGELTLWNVQVDFGGPSPVCVDIDIDIAYSRIAPTAGVQTSPDLSAIVQEFMDDLIPDDLPVHTMVLRIEGGEGLVLEATGGSFYAAAASGIIVIDVPDCDGNNCLEDMQGDVEVCSEFYGCDTLEDVFMYSSPSKVTSTIPTWGPAVGGNVVTILGDGLGDGSDIFEVSIEGNLASVGVQTCTSVVVTIPACTDATCTGGSDFDADVTVKSSFFGVTTGADLYHYNAAGMITMVDPTAGQYRGANWVTIYGTGLGSGDDITTVTLWGIATRVLEQTPTSVVVVAGACTGDFCTDAPGEVVVTSVAYGVTSQAGAYQYLVDESCRLFKECDDVESELCAMSETCEVYPCPVSMGGRCSWCRDPCNDPVADCHDRGISSYFPGFDLDDICPS